ncbi:murein biosynthesis integral membrane protein MurJ [Thermaerobacter subterraneus]|uniref:Probable lipid II flippase MurJ n=1 Tax=Thermaerobacter subterraneus DSM 13965 TaxID=867903 RepID=K6QCE2_9FIRM|nr:murein biosynthesis integral membrane protein MurJ [Thermaerobacter subterraneus]EKP94176.1 integral membrane protein MviN [Thermaerobacter subterraneus DSM 13965]
MSRQRLARSVGLFVLLTTIGRLLGFGREMALAAVFGASDVSDAYTISFSIPGVLFVAFGTAITTVMVPMLAAHRGRGDLDRFRRLAWTLFHTLLLLLLILLAVAMLGSGWLVRIFAPGFTGEQFELARRLTLIMLPGIVFMGMEGWMEGVLNASKRFTAPAAASIPMNLVLIGATWFLGTRYGIEAVAWGSLAGFASQVLLQWGALRRAGVGYLPVLDLGDPELRVAGRRTLPVLLATATRQASQVVNRALASGLPAGSAAALSFAYRVYQLPLGLLAIPLVTVLYPEMAEQGSQQRLRALSSTMNRALRLLTFVMAPITVGTVLLREDITALVYQRGAFDRMDTLMTATALCFYGLGMVPFAWRELLARAMYSLGDTRTPATNGMMSMGLSIVLALVLVRFLDHGGIALATALATWWAAVVLILRLQRRYRDLRFRSLAVGVLQAAVATAVMGGAIALLRVPVLAAAGRWLGAATHGAAGAPGAAGAALAVVAPGASVAPGAVDIAALGFLPRLAGTLVLVAVGAAVYALMLVLLRVEERTYVLDLVRRRGRGSHPSRGASGTGSGGQEVAPGAAAEAARSDDRD